MFDKDYEIALRKNVAANARMLTGLLFILSLIAGLPIAAFICCVVLALAIVGDLLAGRLIAYWCAIASYGATLGVMVALIIKFGFVFIG